MYGNDREVLIGEPSTASKELPCQPIIFRLVGLGVFIRRLGDGIDQFAVCMLLKKSCPIREGFVGQGDNLQFILQIGRGMDTRSILVRIDVLESLRHSIRKALQRHKSHD